MMKNIDLTNYDCTCPARAEACRRSVDELLEPARHDLRIVHLRAIGNTFPERKFATSGGELFGNQDLIADLARAAGYEATGGTGKLDCYTIRKCRIKLPFVVEDAYQEALKRWGHYRPVEAAAEFHHCMRLYGYPVRLDRKKWKVLTSLDTAAERLAYIEDLLLIQGNAR